MSPVVAPGTLPVGDLATGVSMFCHPQAQRQLLLGHTLVAYALARAHRRSIGFLVSADGLTVRAPYGITLSAIDDAVRSKQAWIVRKLTDMHQRQAQRTHAVGSMVWCDGMALPYLGHPLRVHLSTDPAVLAHHAALWRSWYAQRHSAGAAATEPSADQAAPSVYLSLPPDAPAHRIRQAARAWFVQAAQQHLTARLDHFAPLLGVRWHRLGLSNARTRWGSARSDASIRLNWRLLHAPPEMLDYVVVHELSHLRFMDHSAAFWATVASVLPGYASVRQRLRHWVLPEWDQPLDTPTP